jgi:hypothetical protein
MSMPPVGSLAGTNDLASDIVRQRLLVAGDNTISVSRSNENLIMAADVYRGVKGRMAP